MPTQLSAADVERIAALAHLELTDEEKRLFTRQLAEILAYAEQVQELDTTGVPATAHVEVSHSAGHSAEREDALRPSLPAADALDSAVDADPAAGFFKVPRVIGG